MAETFSGMQLRAAQSERGPASRLSEQKCSLQNGFESIFASFGLPELNCAALANEATVYGIAQFLLLHRQKRPQHPTFR